MFVPVEFAQESQQLAVKRVNLIIVGVIEQHLGTDFGFTIGSVLLLLLFELSVIVYYEQRASKNNVSASAHYYYLRTKNPIYH